jgi:hypothetical protein
MKKRGGSFSWLTGFFKKKESGTDNSKSETPNPLSPNNPQNKSQMGPSKNVPSQNDPANPKQEKQVLSVPDLTEQLPRQNGAGKKLVGTRRRRKTKRKSRR